MKLYVHVLNEICTIALAMEGTMLLLVRLILVSVSLAVAVAFFIVCVLYTLACCFLPFYVLFTGNDFNNAAVRHFCGMMAECFAQQPLRAVLLWLVLYCAFNTAGHMLALVITALFGWLMKGPIWLCKRLDDKISTPRVIA
jgi:hypothetical protein